MKKISGKALKICIQHPGCEGECPLKKACAMHAGDTQEIHAERVNEAAEKLP